MRETLLLLACSDLLLAIRDGVHISERAFEILVESEGTPEDRKKLIIGLKCAGLIDDETAGFAIGYRWPLKNV